MFKVGFNFLGEHVRQVFPDHTRTFFTLARLVSNVGIVIVDDFVCLSNQIVDLVDCGSKINKVD
ncbi:MAG: hypothetical protein Q3976_06260 [Corynebacterium sp.]|nr:hypothetical protein [Corynebacterium sp.]